MNSLLSLILGLTMAMVLFVGGVAGASWMMREPAPHQFAHLDERPLWTNRPVSIDPKDQPFERIAAAPVPPVFLAMAIDLPDQEERSVATVSTDDGFQNASLDMEMTGAIEDQPAMNLADTPHAQWCAQRYNSYRVEDDSYQPYNGPRRSCDSPYMASPLEPGMEPDMAADVLNAETVAYDAGGQRAVVQGDNSHVNWCLQRYRSYNVGDNTYQPFNGPRRTCESPFG